MKKSLKEKSADTALYLFMILIIVITLYPFYYCLVMSFNNGHDSNRGGIYLFPRVFTLANYEVAFQNHQMGKALLVTTARTVVGTLSSVLFTAAVAYGLSKENLMFRKFYMIMGITTMYFSGGLIPFYFVLKSLSMLNTFMVFIIPNLFGFFNAILFIAFFKNIPASLKEAARIDGASEAFVFFRIVLRLSTPILATIALFNGIGQWNSWFDSQFFTTNPNLKTLQLILFETIALAAGQEKLKQQLGVTNESAAYTLESIRYATMMIAIGPIIAIYPFITKYFTKGIMLGAVKG
ncbi:carbohydrate ABC transporter permease [Paenibacillus spongiae]|uniref:Carbohydrate ABC transporter permease n=1 Tax=Paenibacillus spongiae TaxID=2909671 RepID=A0ABY5S1X1_9BACL|nr:carbohydrate ABC transporter permease [Paenibacillus spongiae]UVI27443.1 carbohydrate ABC transporter permease [Paenibacillus spongiae]